MRQAADTPSPGPPATDDGLDYRLLFDRMSEGFALHEMLFDEGGKPCDYRFLAVNPAFERMTGLARDRLIGRTVLEVLPGTEPFWIEFYGRVVATGEPASTESFSAGIGRWYAVTAFRPAPGRFCCFVSDITERKKIEEGRLEFERKLLQTQKLESLGILAGGIAHNFNNLLMAILGNAELALADLSPLSPARASLLEIEAATRRAADLARQMLAYSGKGRFVLERLDLNALVREMSHLLEVTLSKKAVLKYNFADPLPPIEGDPTQIRQVVMNLLTNASEAVGETSGMVALSTGAMTCDRAYLEALDPAAFAGDDAPPPEGTYVFLEVADTGCGMDAETLRRAFDPFFTTKFTGRGLGLAAVLGIVRGHKGAVKVYSEPGRGTTFKVLFPAAEGAAEKPDAAAEHLPPAWRGSGVVLVADDEETVRAITRRQLERLGFEVRTAADGEETLERFQAEAGRIACVLLDLTMPKLGGEEVFRELRRLRPDVRVILMSGYNEQDATQRFTGKRLAGFLQKPFRARELAAKLEEILGGAPPGPGGR